MPAFAGFCHGRSETLGVTTASSTGTTVTASASTNTFGSWASLGQTTFGYDWVNLYMAQTAASDKVIEIGVSSDNSTWYTIAGGLRLAGRKSADIIQSLALPLRIRSGAYVAVRVKASSASHVLNVAITGSSVGMKGGTGYSRALALYTDASSRGVSVDAGASANTKSSWVQLTASTTASVDSIYVMIGQNADTGRTAAATALLDIGVGASSGEFAMIPNILMRWTTTLDGPQINVGPLPCYIPAGSRVVARAQCTDTVAGDRTMDVGVVGFVP
jgi:hypothetical protein